jgi:pimeloyl-ACP methyl ester carboxylesterase
MLCALLAAGCTPSEAAQADARLREMAARPVRLQRPVLLVHEWLDSPRRFDDMRRHLAECAVNSAAYVYPVSLDGSGRLDVLAAALADRHRHLGEVDAVAHGMGALVVRQAACRHGLRVRRLLSLAGPHRGGHYVPLLRGAHDQLRDLAPGSLFLAGLNADSASRNFETVTFRIETDPTVPYASAHGEGNEHHELPLRLTADPHRSLPQDPRVIEMAVRRLLEP